MRLLNIMVIIFLISAFAIGIAIKDQDIEVMHSALDNATISISNITLDSTSSSEIPNLEGLFTVIEKYIHFVGVFAIEFMRAGISFGHDNPEYFEPMFLITIMKLLVWALLISLLIKPAGYLIIFIVMGVIFIVEKIKARKTRHKLQKPTKEKQSG